MHSHLQTRNILYRFLFINLLTNEPFISEEKYQIKHQCYGFDTVRKVN